MISLKNTQRKWKKPHKRKSQPISGWTASGWIGLMLAQKNTLKKKNQWIWFNLSATPSWCNQLLTKRFFIQPCRTAAEAVLVPLTPQSIWMMPPKLKMWPISRFPPFQGITAFLEDTSHILIHRHPLKIWSLETLMVYVSHIGFFCPVLPKGRHGVKVSLKTQGKEGCSSLGI